MDAILKSYANLRETFILASMRIKAKGKMPAHATLRAIPLLRLSAWRVMRLSVQQRETGM